MSKTIRQFDYRVYKMKKTDTLPNDPIVQIILEHWMRDSGGDAPIISPHLMTEGEIDEHIQALKADLDAVGKRAKAALAQAKTETRAIVSARNTTN